MKNKRKSYRRIIWGGLSVIMATVALVIFMLIYVADHQKELASYRRSIENLDEVDSLLEFSHFVGLDEYFVAKIRRVNEEQYFYFIKDGIVQYQLPVADVITAELVQSAAIETVGSGTVLHKGLGIYLDEPIYEVRVRTERGVEHVIINALTMEIVLHFIL